MLRRPADRAAIALTAALAAGGAVGGAGGMLARPALAASHDADRLHQQVQDAEREHAAQLRAEHDAAQRARSAADDSARLAAAREQAAAHLHVVDAAVNEASARLAASRQGQKEAEAAVRGQAAALSPFLPLIERLSLFPAETLLAAPAAPADSVRALLVLRGLTRGLAARAEALRTEQARLRQTLQEIGQQQDALEKARSDQAGQAAALDRQIAAAEAARHLAEDQAARAAHAAQAASRQASDLRGAVAALEADRHAADAKLRKPPPERDSSPPPRHGSMTVPVAGNVVHGWGDATDAGPANGLTYQSAPGARVMSACAGRVLFAGPFRSYGKLLIVDCGHGLRLVLAGMDRLDVAVGQKLAPGQAVGAMPGDTPNLYVEVRQGERPVDPAPYLGSSAGLHG